VIQPNGNAPYAPAATVIELIERFRNHGLTVPFTVEVLLKAGIPDSLASRTLQALRLLDLVDAEGMPTDELVGLAKSTSEEYPKKLQEVLRAAYAEVFSFVDPAVDSIERVEDAFRGYSPRGQRARMVSLFLGLCKHAEIVENQPAKPSARSASGSAPRIAAQTVRTPKLRTLRSGPIKRTNQNSALPSALPAPLSALLDELAVRGPVWTRDERDTYLAGFRAMLDIYYPPGTVGSDRRPRGELLPGGTN